MLSRRELIGKAAVGAAATLAVSAAGVASARALERATTGPSGRRDGDGQHDDGQIGPVTQQGDGRDTGPTPADTIESPPPWQLLRPLGAGAKLAHGWRLVDLSPVRHGSSVVTLENACGR